jgi:hypothetical protein
MDPSILVNARIARDLTERQFAAAERPRPSRTPVASASAGPARSPMRRSTARVLRRLADRIEAATG